MKRIVLFVITNLAVMLVLSATLRILGVDRYITAQGLNLQALLVFSVVVGFTGAIISLLISKPMAKWSTGAQVLDPNAPRNQREAWLLDTVHQLADRAGIGRPKSPSTKARRTPSPPARSRTTRWSRYPPVCWKA